MSNTSSPLIFGEVLFDCFPDGGRVLGGAPFNVAWHCQAFGLDPVFISRVGDDALGQQVLSAMRDWGMDTAAVQQDQQHATGVVQVEFVDGEPSYDIVENSAWDFIDTAALPPTAGDGWLYHGSLAMRQSTSAEALQAIRGSGRSLFVDVNLRPPWWQLDRLAGVIDNVQLLKLNLDELLQLVPGAASTEQAMGQLMEQRGLELLVVTRGAQGVIAQVAGEPAQTFAPRPAAHVVDTVGAGDAFSSVLLLGQHRGWSLQDSVLRAQAFASAIVGIQGATINDRAFYQPFLSDWKL